MLKELYAEYKDAGNKFEFLKAKTQEQLKGLASYIFENSHSVRDERKTDMNLYGDVAKAMIYKGLNGLDKNSTEEDIKNAIVKVDFLNEVAGIKDKHKDAYNAKYKESIAKVAEGLAKKIEARGGNPKDAFEAIALDNPDWFRQIIEFFARCLFISTEYNSMRSMKNEVQSMNEEVKMTELRKNVVKDRDFEQVIPPAQINGSAHKIGRVKKAVKDGETSDQNKYKQEWFEKSEKSLYDRLYWWSATIGDHHKREVIGAEIMRFLMGNQNVPKYRLTEDGSVISQKIGFDKGKREYKKEIKSLASFLAKDDNINFMDLAIKAQQGDAEALQKLRDIQTNFTNMIKSNDGLKKEFTKIQAYSAIAGDIDSQLCNIMYDEAEGTMTRIDFGYALTDMSTYNGITSMIIPNKFNVFSTNYNGQALKEVVADVEAKKEELFSRIEDVCHGLGIGPNETKLVLDAINKNIDFVKREAGMEVNEKQV